MEFSPPAVPLQASFLPGGPDVCRVVFDRTLLDVPSLDLLNWNVRYSNVAYTASAAYADGKRVVLDLVMGGANVGIDMVQYTPPPSDVLTRKHHAPVVAFYDFPIT